LSFDTAVIVLKELFNSCLKSLKIFNLAIDTDINVDTFHEVSEDDALGVVDVGLAELEVVLRSLNHQVGQEVTVTLANHSIAEHASVLMVPDADKFDRHGTKFGVSTNNTLENLRDISQVKCVVRLAGGGLERTIQNLIVGFKLGLNQTTNAISHIVTKRSEESISNCGVNSCDSIERHISVRNDVEVALQTLGNDSTTATGWAHSRDSNDINNSVEGLFLGLALVPASVVHELTDKLKRGLGSVFFLGGHVKVINEHDVLLAKRRAIDTFATLFKLIIKVVLGLVGAGLGREAHNKSLVLFGHFEGNKFIYVHRFTGTSGAWHHHVLVIHNESFHEVLHAHRVLSGHHNFGVAHLGVDSVLRNNLQPSNPFVLLNVEEPIVDSFLSREVNLMLR